MQLSVLFWLIMVVWLLLGFGGWYKTENRTNWGIGGFFVEWVVIALLGWKVFGWIIQN